MAEGLEIINNSGSLQISTETSVVSFLRKGSVQFQRAVNNDSVDSSYYAKVTCNPSTELCFVSCSEPVSYLYNDSGQLYIGLSYNGDSPRPTLYYWVFGKATTISNQGLQVFDGNGTDRSNLLFDSSWKPLKPISIVTSPELTFNGSHTKTLPSSRVYAFMPLQVTSETFRETRELNQTGTVDQEWEINYSRRDYAAQLIGRNLTIRNTIVDYYFYFYFGSRNWNDRNFDTSNNVQTRYLVVDVTGL